MVKHTSIVVAKFGGTSVADYAAMQRCATIVSLNRKIRLVVVSASAGVTNRLELLSAGVEDAQQRASLIDEITAIQMAIISDAYSAGVKVPAGVIGHVQELLSTAAVLAENIANERAYPGTGDELLAVGELCSSQLFSVVLSHVLAEQGEKSEAFDARQVIRTDDHFGQAEPRPTRIGSLVDEYLQPALKRCVQVTQGFIGADAAGRTTTLGRGGSDFSAALFAEACDACLLQVWTDVDGIYTCDPRVVATAYPIPELSFAEAAEMATFGAKILHPATLLPAVRGKIPVFVGCSREPEKPGTRIVTDSASQPVCRALSIRRKQTLLTVRSLNMLHARGFLAELFSVLARHRISVDLITTSEVSVALTLDKTGSEHSGKRLISGDLLADLEQMAEVSVEENLALVAVIGNKLTSTPEVAERIFGQLKGHNVRMVSHGASANNLCFLVGDAESDLIMNKLHDGLIGGR